MMEERDRKAVSVDTSVEENTIDGTMQLALNYDPASKDAFEKFKKDHNEPEKLAEFMHSQMGSRAGGGMPVPKNATEGVSSGLLTFGSSVVGGVGSLAYYPVSGASKEGVKGFCKGLAKGVGGLVVIPCVGLGAGVMQIGRGISNTPDAHRKRAKGYEWDKVKRCWVSPISSLPSELDRIEFEIKCSRWCMEEMMSTYRRLMNFETVNKEVKETGYYDLLNLTPDATQVDIKKSYLKLARSSHPDKIAQEEIAKGRDGPEYQNSDGQLIAVEETKARFQEISRVYHVLSNPEQRKIYDLSGHNAEGLENSAGEEDELKFLFCSEELTPWIGEPSFMNEFEEMTEIDEQDKLIRLAIDEQLDIDIGAYKAIIDKQTKKVNQIRIAVELEERLTPYINILRERKLQSAAGSSQGGSKTLETSPSMPTMNTQKEIDWEASVRQSIKQIMRQRIGPALLSMVGWVYCNRATVQLGRSSFLGHKAQRANIQAFSKKVSTYKKLMSQTHQMVKMNGAVNKLMDGQQEEAMNPDMIPCLLETMFQFHGVYCMEQVTKQFKYFFKDSLYTKEERSLRAHALLHLGSIINDELAKFKELDGNNSIDWMEHITEQQIKRMEKQDEEFMKTESKYHK